MEAFLNSVFFKLYMPRNISMSSFQWSWPYRIWSYSHRDMASRRKVTQYWKILWRFSLKNLYLPIRGRFINPFLWEVAKTLFFKMVQPDCSIFCPISIVYCAKLAQKLPVFPIKKKKRSEDFIRVFGILVISHPF